ncbi:MAG: hypothetical protein PVF85_08525 [Anaerolineales bacterium]|jgi:hypothetical protein
MINETLALLIFLITLIFALIGWVFQIIVARRLKKSGIDSGVQVGKRSWITPFILGWKNSEALGIDVLMTVWSVILGITILGVILTVYFFVSIYQP